MNKIFLIFLTFISFLSFTQESVKNDLEVESIHVCHWKKVEQGICKKGDFLDWFSAVQRNKKLEITRSIMPRFFCEPGTYYQIQISGGSVGMQGSLLDQIAGGSRIFCVYNGAKWINVIERK